MSDVPVVPEMKEELGATKSGEKATMKKSGARKNAAKKSMMKGRKKAQRKIVRSSAKKAPVRRTVAKRKRQPFPYLRVLKMWQAGKSSMAIAKAIGRHDSKATDPMHSFRVTLTRFHKGVRIDGKLVKLPHRVSQKALKRATKAGRKASG